MQSAKVTAANVAASAQAGLEKTKAAAQETVEKLTSDRAAKKETEETKQQTVKEQHPDAANQQATEVKSNPAAVADAQTQTIQAKTTQ
ncbi:uncharacterized protein LOC107777457 [Nicotiana tabacum]|uniref:11 kDa late embryogenesis abundant protein n=2 Tax=Nicotiana TaxID=4085 RepID=A0A1S3YLM0_TOBAC|nr:PREDICTED: 11 kDa late embryogenesis abundant protein-like [Nicotiana sylvestris]XP_016452963.1 PREDICTED: 11 kDa late embryogenesis abundant protein-like [Nicotiana tabacum]